MCVCVCVCACARACVLLANASIPLSYNFIGEFISLIAAFEYSFIIGLLASLGMVLSAGYSIYLYNRICFGFIYISPFVM